MTRADYDQVAKLIDHALLLPNLDKNALEAGIELARVYDVASVCILPYFVGRARAALEGSSVLTTTTIGFPHGGNSTDAKLAEAKIALDEGADELDMLVNVSRVLSGEWREVRTELAQMVELVHGRGKKLKLIFETAYLDEAQKQRLCELCGELRVDWVKTSTGFGPSGATLADVKMMREASPAHVAVKASGGVRDLDTLLTLRPFVTRIGTSHTRAILDEWRRRLDLPALSGSPTSASSSGARSMY
ncbi:MAG: deoxyribose-phosphate aldolase [Myxococcota bacterium]